MDREIQINLPKGDKDCLSYCENTLPSQQCLRIIDVAIARIPKDCDFQRPHLRSLLHQTITELELNKLEVVVWLMHLDEMMWKTHHLPIKMALLFPALITKKKLHLNISGDLEKFRQKMPNILRDFDRWQSANKLDFDITLCNINKKYKELSISNNSDLINYNYYVDDILANSIKYSKIEKHSDKMIIIRKPNNHSFEDLDDIYHETDFPKID